jgi:hypothetical protein
MLTCAIRVYFWPAVGAAHEACGVRHPADQQLAIEPKGWIGFVIYFIIERNAYLKIDLLLFYQ